MAETTTSIYDIDAETLKKVERLSAEYAAKNAKAEGARETYRLAHEILEGLASAFDERKKFYWTKKPSTKKYPHQVKAQRMAFTLRCNTSKKQSKNCTNALSRNALRGVRQD